MKPSWKCHNTNYIACESHQICNDSLEWKCYTWHVTLIKWFGIVIKMLDFLMTCEFHQILCWSLDDIVLRKKTVFQLTQKVNSRFDFQLEALTPGVLQDRDQQNRAAVIFLQHLLLTLWLGSSTFSSLCQCFDWHSSQSHTPLCGIRRG